MASRDREPTDHPSLSREELLARRGAQRRERNRRARRRRLLAGGSLATAAIVAAVLLATGGDDSPDRGSHFSRIATGTSAAPSGSAKAAARARNATPQPGWEPHTGPVPILEYH